MSTIVQAISGKNHTDYKMCFPLDRLEELREQQEIVMEIKRLLGLEDS